MGQTNEFAASSLIIQQAANHSLLFSRFEIIVDVIDSCLHPGRVKPLGRFNGSIGNIGGIVEMIPSGHAGISRAADNFFLLNFHTWANIHLR